MENDETIETAEARRKRRISIRNKLNYQKNKEAILAMCKAWRVKNPEHCKEINKRWRSLHHERTLEYGRRSRAKNPGYLRQYWEEHKDEINARRRQMNAEKREQRKQMNQ